MNGALQARNITLSRKLNRSNLLLHKEKKKVSKSLTDTQIALSKLGFKEDQIRCIIYKYKKISYWSNDTVMDAMKLRFACGSQGYQDLLNRGFPFPSIRTLSEKMENLKFLPGQIIPEILKFLEIKVTHLKDIWKHCLLVLDEMSITEGLFLDPATNTMLGKNTLGNTEENATKTLVFLLAGLSARWKQVIRYEFTNEKYDGGALRPIIDEIIIAVENLSLRLHVVTADMGPNNQGMWKAYGITDSGRYVKPVNYCIHPADKNRKLYFCADGPHLSKNMACGFRNNPNIIIPKKFVDKYKLPCTFAQYKHLHDLLQDDESSDFKFNQKLRDSHLEKGNHFADMKVCNARAVVCEATVSGLLYQGTTYDDKSKITTAWYISQLSRWFDIVCSRNVNLSLSNKNPKMREEVTTFLKEFMELMNGVVAGAQYKPWQRGAQITTQSILDLSKYLLDNGFKYFMPGRCSQDCIENLFSLIRSVHPVPNCLQLKQDLRLITVSQYTATITNSSYENDDAVPLSGFLNFINKKKTVPNDGQDILLKNMFDTLPPQNSKPLNFKELNLLYYYSGFVLKQINKIRKLCKQCTAATLTNSSTKHRYSFYVKCKERTLKNLWYVNDATFNFFFEMEIIFKNFYEPARCKNLNLQQFFIHKFQNINFKLPDCQENCNLKSRIIKRYQSMRLKSRSSRKGDKKNVKKQYASKTQSMHQDTK